MLSERNNQKKHIAANWLDSGDSSLPAARRASSGAPLLRYGIATQQTARLNVRWHFGCQVGLLNSASHWTVQSGSCHCGSAEPRQACSPYGCGRCARAGLDENSAVRRILLESQSPIPSERVHIDARKYGAESCCSCHRDHLPCHFVGTTQSGTLWSKLFRGVATTREARVSSKPKPKPRLGLDVLMSTLGT